MTLEELDLIRNIIDNEAEAKNVDGLIKLKDYLNQKIYNIRDKKEENYYILTLDLREFMDRFITKKDTGFKRNSVYRAVRNMAKKERIEVADSIGIGSEKLLSNRNIGRYTANIYEKTLNSFGYSLDQELPEEKKDMIKVYKMEKNID